MTVPRSSPASTKTVKSDARRLLQMVFSPSRHRSFIVATICFIVLLLLCVGNIVSPVSSTDRFDIELEATLLAFKDKIDHAPVPIGSDASTDVTINEQADPLTTGVGSPQHPSNESTTPSKLMPDTRFDNIANLLLIGETSGVTVGRHAVVDVYTGLYKSVNQEDPLADLLSKANDKEPESNPAPQTGNTDSVVPNESSLGWKADAHKNLPGFRELYSRFPSADWFVMLDDDTYMFFDNLQQLVGKLDPELPHYFGSATMFLGCDDVKNWGEGPFFAHGGSGIVLSRGAIKKLVSTLDTCIVRYKSCWAGDIRTSLCLRDNNILLKDPKGFNGMPPNKDYAYPNTPCLKPLTFHHLLTRQIQKLFDLERRVLDIEKRSVTMADIYRDWSSDTEGVVLSDTDMPGNDITNFSANDYETCKARCQALKTCISFVFSKDNHRCWLKDRIPQKKSQNGMMSGIVPSNYVCTK
ncbi:hypothetical protein BASA83_012480 [Batrachochytrium salamandrivorans]|nr:hypothetical protein BASA83_012480 [Batrachochytrium salamandrivorans]